VGQFAKKQIGSHSLNMNRFVFRKHGQRRCKLLLRYLVVFICLLSISCDSEIQSVESEQTPVPQGPSIISNSSDTVVESWKYISPRSEEALVSFPSSASGAIEFGPEHYEAYIVWRTGGFDLIWGNFACSTQPILVIKNKTIELWLNNAVWEDCEAAEVIHAFKVELETDIPPEEWIYILYPDAPPSVN
jgi:hypothetical protein